MVLNVISYVIIEETCWISTKDGYLWYLTIKTGVAFSNSYVDFFAGVNNGDLHGISSWDLISGWW